MYKKFRVGAPLAVLSVSLLISGCGFGGEKAGNELDPPKKVSYENSLDNKKGSKTAVKSNMVKRQLFLMDKNGLVVPQMLELPKSKSPAEKQVLEYLVKDGPVSNMLPNGFQAVLPADTEVLGVNVKGGTATANFSKEFKDYEAKNEQKILQAITFTLTQFHSIKNVKIQIEGKDLKSMPVNNTPIGNGVSRADGINIEAGDVVDLTNSESVTLYFINEDNNQKYYVPVTRRVAKTSDEDLVTETVNELIKGPSFTSNLQSDFREDVKLLTKPTVKNGVVTLNFNEAVLQNKRDHTIADDALNSIVLSLTELQDIQKVAIQVDGKERVMKENGKKLTTPVSRPKMVNTREF
ncbi:GerMN domain-containing protein [Fictibacillus gelatini]|uniref:GerMN domain-containing protein n=1 Tax=Fictibacillus gelatini TaxID=225985 RepID=UPI00040EAFE7|nr:GerMN domain-containing protein [Fictibacillus gelatini]